MIDRSGTNGPPVVGTRPIVPVLPSPTAVTTIALLSGNHPAGHIITTPDWSPAITFASRVSVTARNSQPEPADRIVFGHWVYAIRRASGDQMA
ncbi:MAG: hypothetical protein ACREF4_17635, partial [Gammaproteobacteria bacterium]